jgi:hypothetical protein
MGYTECPGQYLYAKIPTIRAAVTSYLGPGLVGPSLSTTATSVTVRAGVLKSAQTWRVELRDAESSYVFRTASGSGPVDATLPYTDLAGSPLPGGRYVLSVQSALGTATARPYEPTLNVVGSEQTDAVFLPDGSLATVTRDKAGLVVLQTRPSGDTVSGSPVALGAYLIGRPTVAVGAGGRLVVGIRGINNLLYVKRQLTGGTWPATWERVGGPISGTPAVVPNGADLDVLARGADGSLWSWSSMAGGPWSAGASDGGGLKPGTSVGAVRTADGTLHVVIHGLNEGGWYRRKIGDTWDKGYTPLGGTLRGDVDIAPTSDSGSLVVSAWGTSGRPFLRKISAGVPQTSWTLLGAIQLSTAPALVDRSPSNATRTFARDQKERLLGTSVSGTATWAPVL